MRKQIEEFTKEFVKANGLEEETSFNLEICWDGTINTLDYRFNCNGEMPQVLSDIRTEKEENEDVEENDVKDNLRKLYDTLAKIGKATKDAEERKKQKEIGSDKVDTGVGGL